MHAAGTPELAVAGGGNIWGGDVPGGGGPGVFGAAGAALPAGRGPPPGAPSATHPSRPAPPPVLFRIVDCLPVTLAPPPPRRGPGGPPPRREPARPAPQRELQQDSNRGQRPPPKAVWRPAADADEGWEQPYDDEADWDAPPARRPRRGRR